MVSETPLGRVLPRRVATELMAALQDTRVVLLNGARQSGKSTLLRMISDRRADVVQRNLDEDVTLSFAREDPASFVEHDGLMIIDEIQRAPELMLAIKADVDARYRPGAFLLTGSARVLGLRDLPDALPGRMESIELWPFSQGELHDAPDGFVDAIFRHGIQLKYESELGRSDYVDRIVVGGFAEAVARRNPRRRRAFFRSYVQTLIERDVSQLSEIQRVAEMRTVVGLLAARAGGLLVPNALATQAGLSIATVTRYIGLLEETFLIKRVPAWAKNVSTRAVSTPKLLFVDSGLATALLDIDVSALLQPGNSLIGSLAENFVLGELARQLSWTEQEVRLFHYRTRDNVEVDAVLENARGEVVGIEVKAAATARPDDFKGLRHLADRLGEAFIAGVVLYSGKQTLSFGGKFAAMPISAVWRTES